MTAPLTKDERVGMRAWAVADIGICESNGLSPDLSIGDKILRLLADLERAEAERDYLSANPSMWVLRLEAAGALMKQAMARAEAAEAKLAALEHDYVARVVEYGDRLCSYLPDV